MTSCPATYPETFGDKCILESPHPNYRHEDIYGREFDTEDTENDN